MRNMMWICAAFILLWSEAWSQDAGTNQSTTVSSNTPPRPPAVIRHSVFDLGSDVDLMCSNKTWNETIFVIWNIRLKTFCKISFSNDGRSEDFCNDGKSLQNTSSNQSYLHIPNFSNEDVGIYECESVFKGGIEIHEIHVDITVGPDISSWLEPKDNKMVAVCKAERGKPAANISWINKGNSSLISSSVETRSESDGFFTVESHLELSEGMDAENLSCVVRHPYWKEAKTLAPQAKQGYVLWPCILTVVVIVVFLAGYFIFSKMKLMVRRCQQSDTSPSKSPPTEDVEEVEPYASYVQRVNSIYNSSADLFT